MTFFRQGYRGNPSCGSRGKGCIDLSSVVDLHEILHLQSVLMRSFIQQSLA